MIKPTKEGLVEMANALIKAIDAQVEAKQEEINFLQKGIEQLNRKASWLRKEITN